MSGLLHGSVAEWCKACCDEIRAKTGSNELIKAQDIPSKILSIPTASGGLQVTTSLVLASDKVKTTGPVTLTATLKADYDDINPLNIDFHGFLIHADVSFFSGDGTLLYHGITNLNGQVSFTTNITENSSFYCLYYGTGDYNPCMSNEISVEYQTAIYIPLFDGTEPLKTLQGTAKFENNTLTGSASAYLNDGWDNTIDWKLEADFLLSGTDTGFIIASPSTTSRDYDWLQWRYNGYSYFNYNTAYSTDYPSISFNQFHHIVVSKIGNQFTFKIDNGSEMSFTWSRSSSFNKVFVGIDRWTSPQYCTLKNVVVEEV